MRLSSLLPLLTALVCVAPVHALQAVDQVLLPDAVFDGEVMHPGWAVRVQGERIVAVGPRDEILAAGGTRVDLAGTTLLPGLIEGHAHLLLHPYDETPWTDQVLLESWG